MNAPHFNGLFGLLTLCCALSACNRSNDQAQAPAAATVAAAAASSSSNDPLSGMVKAVAADARHHTIDLRFQLASRPEVGAPVEIKLALRSIDDATDAKLTISVDPKLAIIAGNEAAFASLKGGEVVNHTMTLRPMDNGIIVVNATFTASANGSQHTDNYAIPVAVVVAAAQSSSAAAATAPK